VLSCPAWAPVLSLESIDGKLWEDMREDLSALLKNLPGPEKLKIIAKKHLDIMTDVNNRTIIDANYIALITMKVFVEFVFNREWESKFNVLVEASWEWRKEIAAKGRADKKIKDSAIEMTISLIRESNLWPLFDEKWREPRYYSLILQPFLISPTINTGDSVVAFLRYPDLDVSDALRQMHPFPILERFLSKDIMIDENNDYSAVNKCPFNGIKNKENDKKIAVCKDTQVVMFPSDWRENKNWPIFGAGKRVCSGAHLALPWLTIFRESMLQIINHEKKNEKNDGEIKNKNEFISRFQPELNHRYSGRNNDNGINIQEIIYFLINTLPPFLKNP